MRTILPTMLLLLAYSGPVWGAEPYSGMVKLKLDGRAIEGRPLAWSAQEVYLLDRGGRLWEFEPARAADFRKSSSRFRSYTPSEIRADLLRELGKDFEVTGTSHYLVAHRRTERDEWAQRFEDLYRSFIHYFSVRGFRPRTPPFLLVGVVCKNQRDFHRYLSAQGTPVPPGVLGLYSLRSNQITLYDMGGKYGADNWHDNAAVIIHEATHQSAFNTGVHSRYTPPPTWVVEGLATMFEARGVYDSRRYTQRSERVNRGRLRDFRRLVAPRHKPELLRRLVQSDGLFRSSPSAAYAEAWALTFYLAETQPRKWTRYLELTARKPPFTDYTAPQRLADFTSVFGDGWMMLEASFLRFMETVR